MTATSILELYFDILVIGIKSLWLGFWFSNTDLNGFPNPKAPKIFFQHIDIAFVHERNVF